MQNARKVILAITLASIILCSFFNFLDAPATQRIDAGLKRALISFGTARTLNAVISVAQGTEIAIQPMGVGVTLTPGQLLEPINDLVEKFATLMMAACVALGIQKMLISIGANWLVSLFLTISALGWAWLYFRQQQPPRWLSRMLVILLMIRFAIPMVTIGTDLLFQKYLATEYMTNQQAIGKASGQVTELKPPVQAPTALTKDNVSWWDKGLVNIKEMARSLASKTSAAVDVKAHAKNLQQSAEKWIEHIINLIVIFLLQTLIIPFLLIWALYAVVKGTFEPAR